MASAKEIPPGGEGKIDVTLKTSKSIGPLSKSVTVTSDDPVNPNITLQVKADLEALFVAKPERVHFGRINRNSTSVQTVEFLGKDLDTTQITNISIKNTENASIWKWNTKDERASGQRKLILEITADSKNQKAASFTDNLVIETNNPSVPKLEIVLSGEILGPVNSDPQRVYFANYIPGQEMQRSVKIVSTENQKIKILNAVCTDPNIEIGPVPKEPSESLELSLKLSDKFTGDHIKAELVVTIDNPEQPELKVPINGYKKRERVQTPPKTASEVNLGSKAKPDPEKPNSDTRISASSK